MAAFLAIEMAFLGAVGYLGGPHWAALGVLACCGQMLADFRARSLACLAPAAAWAAAHHLSGNRELFFPFAMFLAAHAAGQFAARSRTAAAIAGAAVVAAFMAVRVAQGAGGRVLAVELVVAVVILAAVLAALAVAGRRPAALAAISALASGLAFAGLALD